MPADSNSWRQPDAVRTSSRKAACQVPRNSPRRRGRKPALGTKNKRVAPGLATRTISPSALSGSTKCSREPRQETKSNWPAWKGRVSAEPREGPLEVVFSGKRQSRLAKYQFLRVWRRTLWQPSATAPCHNPHPAVASPPKAQASSLGGADAKAGTAGRQRLYDTPRHRSDESHRDSFDSLLGCHKQHLMTMIGIDPFN